MVASARTYQKWSAPLIRRMTGLADRGMSAARIAKALGLTRGQVLGKMHRLGNKTKNACNNSKKRNGEVVRRCASLSRRSA